MNTSVRQINESIDSVGAISEEQAANTEEILAKIEQIDETARVLREFVKGIIWWICRYKCRP